MGELQYTTIRRRTEAGEAEEALKMTQEEFDQIVSKYSNGCGTFAKATQVSQRLAQVQAVTFPDEELKMENFNGVDTSGFEKAICLFQYWSEMILREMQKHKNFRIEINYNAEALKTDLYIYTPIEDGTDGIPQEHQEN